MTDTQAENTEGANKYTSQVMSKYFHSFLEE